MKESILEIIVRMNQNLGPVFLLLIKKGKMSSPSTVLYFAMSNGLLEA